MRPAGVTISADLNYPHRSSFDLARQEDVMTVATMHCLERTSPKGGPFIGTCCLCGKPNLRMEQANEFCGNPNSVTAEQALIDAIGGTSEPPRTV